MSPAFMFVPCKLPCYAAPCRLLRGAKCSVQHLHLTRVRTNTLKSGKICTILAHVSAISNINGNISSHISTYISADIRAKLGIQKIEKCFIISPKNA